MKISGRLVFLSFVIGCLNLFGESAYAQGMITTNLQSRWNSVWIPGYRENIAVLSKICGLKWKAAQGREQTRQALVAVSPKNGVVWVGLPGSQLVEMEGAIIGMVTLHDTLVVRVSTNRLSSWRGTEKLETLETDMEAYVTQLDGQSVTPSASNDKRIRLRDIFGLKALKDLRNAAPPESPQLIRTSLAERAIVLRMKSGIGKILILTLDEQLHPLKGVVDDKITFESGKTHPPSLVEELRSSANRESKIDK